MRLWSIHPSYLDSAGLNAAWREGLLALKIARGEPCRYAGHPQMIRFMESPDPYRAVQTYLLEIYGESTRRHFKYNPDRAGDFNGFDPVFIPVTLDQVKYEFDHLMKKIEVRCPSKAHQVISWYMLDGKRIKVNACFKVVLGPVEYWEKQKKGVL